MCVLVDRLLGDGAHLQLDHFLNQFILPDHSRSRMGSLGWGAWVAYRR